MEFTFNLEENAEGIKDLQAFIKDHQDQEGALMPVLQEAQHKFGYLPKEIIEIISEGLKVPISEVYGVITFYSQFTLIPNGEFDVSICMGTACYVRGAQELVNAVAKELGIAVGETTTDMKFSVSETRCLGACGLAPVLTVNEDVYGRIGPKDVKGIIEKYR